MIGTSLTDWRRRVARPAPRPGRLRDRGKTMGIPILYPWANRLSATQYDVDGTTVTLTAGRRRGAHRRTRRCRSTACSPPIRDWRVTACVGPRADRRAGLQRRAAAAGQRSRSRIVLTLTITLSDRTLTVETTVTPTGDARGAAVLRLPPVSAAAGRAARAVADRDPGDAAPAGRRQRAAHRRARSRPAGAQ